MKNPEFYTATMANLYTQQGHFQKAAEIYRFILSKEPNRQDIAEALSTAEEKIAESESEPKDLVKLFKTWFQLTERYRRIQTLRKLKKDIFT